MQDEHGNYKLRLVNAQTRLPTVDVDVSVKMTKAIQVWLVRAYNLKTKCENIFYLFKQCFNSDGGVRLTEGRCWGTMICCGAKDVGCTGVECAAQCLAHGTSCATCNKVKEHKLVTYYTFFFECFEV